MALLRGRLLAGVLFAGALFGPLPQTAPTPPDSTGYGGRIRRSRTTTQLHSLPTLKRRRRQREEGDFFALFKT